VNKAIFFLLVLTLYSINMSAQLNDPRGINQAWKTNLEKSSIDLAEFKVLLKRDGIPPIDRPGFISKEAADSNYLEQEPVIAVAFGEVAKAYPLSVLMWHEIVNDKLAGNLISVTYCPLCNASVVFNRELNHAGAQYVLDFGVSGMLRNSDMVMWDRQTESWWQQFLGEALVGDLEGAQLELIPSQVMSLQDFYQRWPEGKVLSSNTGHEREYGNNPYEYYDTHSYQSPFMFDGELDERLPATERVVDFCVGDQCRVYAWKTISKKKVINDTAFGENVVIFYQSGALSVMDAPQIKNSKKIGAVGVFNPEIDSELLIFEYQKQGYFEDTKTRSKWDITGRCTEGVFEGRQLRPVISGNHFAFAWFAFHPNSEIYR
jgi:hypothetical protein